MTRTFHAKWYIMHVKYTGFGLTEKTLGHFEIERKC